MSDFEQSIFCLLSTTISSTSHPPFYFMSDFLFSPLPYGIFPQRIISLLPILPLYFLIFNFSLCKHLLPPRSPIFFCILCILSSLSTLKPICPNLIVQAARPLGFLSTLLMLASVLHQICRRRRESTFLWAHACVRHTGEERESCPSMMKHTLGWMQVHSSPCSQASIQRGWWNVPIKEERMRKKRSGMNGRSMSGREWRNEEDKVMNEGGSEEIEEKRHKRTKIWRRDVCNKKRKMGNDSKLGRKDFWNNYRGEKG